MAEMNKRQFACLLFLGFSVVGFGMSSPILAAEPVAQPAYPFLTQSPVQPTQPQVTPLTGEVQVMQTLIPANTPAAAASTAAATVAVLQSKDYLDIQLTSQGSKNEFQTFVLNIQNKQPKHIELLQVEVLNGITEQAYLQIQQERSGSKKRLAGGLLRGVTGIASSFVPQVGGLGGAVASQAVGAGTSAVYMAADALENSGNASAANYTGKVVQRANNILVSPNQNFQCLAVVPDKQAPIIKVIFKDLQTSQIFEAQK